MIVLWYTVPPCFLKPLITNDTNKCFENYEGVYLSMCWGSQTVHKGHIYLRPWDLFCTGITNNWIWLIQSICALVHFFVQTIITKKKRTWQTIFTGQRLNNCSQNGASWCIFHLLPTTKKFSLTLLNPENRYLVNNPNMMCLLMEWLLEKKKTDVNVQRKTGAQQKKFVGAVEVVAYY